jgi:hypothetical protein
MEMEKNTEKEVVAKQAVMEATEVLQGYYFYSINDYFEKEFIEIDRDGLYKDLLVMEVEDKLSIETDDRKVERVKNTRELIEYVSSLL